VMMLFMPNAKVSDGSQPPTTSASPPGVQAGARSLDRHGWASWSCHVPQGSETSEASEAIFHQEGTRERDRDSYGDSQGP